MVVIRRRECCRIVDKTVFVRGHATRYTLRGELYSWESNSDIGSPCMSRSNLNRPDRRRMAMERPAASNMDVDQRIRSADQVVGANWTRFRRRESDRRRRHVRTVAMRHEPARLPGIQATDIHNQPLPRDMND